MTPTADVMRLARELASIARDLRRTAGALEQLAAATLGAVGAGGEREVSLAIGVTVGAASGTVARLMQARLALAATHPAVLS